MLIIKSGDEMLVDAVDSVAGLEIIICGKVGNPGFEFGSKRTVEVVEKGKVEMDVGRHVSGRYIYGRGQEFLLLARDKHIDEGRELSSGTDKICSIFGHRRGAM